jgi:hypothetical protein
MGCGVNTKAHCRGTESYFGHVPKLFVEVSEDGPFALCRLDDFKEVIKHLNSNALYPKDNVKFVRGTLLPVKPPIGSKGVMDMCKQAVVPEEITRLLDGCEYAKALRGCYWEIM